LGAPELPARAKAQDANGVKAPGKKAVAQVSAEKARGRNKDVLHGGQ